MTFRWHGSPATDEVVAATGLDQSFATRADAEAWLTVSYEDLAEAGVDEVTLHNDDHVVYGPMSLHP